MKILVTGKNGQLGNAIAQRAENCHNDTFIFSDKDDLDLTSPEEVSAKIRQIKPDILINCAGYTAVDDAEDNEKQAYLLNGTIPGLFAALSKELNFLLIHISTDYVFGGKHYKPYEEDDPYQGRSIYGLSKIAGEENIMIESGRAVIIRTSWLYSATGKNFVKTMLRLGKEKETIGVVFDQIGTPTYAPDLAEAILHIARESKNIKDISIYHYSNEGAVSWYDFAKTIMETARLKCHVRPLLSHEYPSKAPRPFYSVLNKTKIKEDFSLSIPYWKDSLIRCLQETDIMNDH
ncbi:MAG: dTDP-4-dehydrorhamnose reductase [Bacteroidales bacterium]